MDRLLGSPDGVDLARVHGRKPLKDALGRALAAVRSRQIPAAAGELLRHARLDLEAKSRMWVAPVLNGTGVVLHTNLGRAPLAPEARRAMYEAARYASVEMDLDTGTRGSRQARCATLVTEITDADSALVTNNNAAAVALAVNELAAGRRVLVSRGELVEIGGSFRIPDVIRAAGAELGEVGTTNRTRLADYAEAVDGNVAMILRIHPSNYRVKGFASRPTLSELVALGRDRGIPVVHDVGSGLIAGEYLPGFPHEPSVVDSLRAGADLVTWSGDKLMGGPQAGIVAGRTDLVARLGNNHLLRGLRPDKTTLAALEATLNLYRDPDRVTERVPALRMLSETAEQLEARAAAHLPELPPDTGAVVTVERTRALPGGGSFPGHEIESAGWAVRGIPPSALAEACRRGTPPLVARVSGEALFVDARTLGEQIGEAAAALRAAVVSLP